MRKHGLDEFRRGMLQKEKVLFALFLYEHLVNFRL